MFEFLTNGNVINAYNIFIAFTFWVGAFGWLLWGIKEKRIYLALALGLLWFCLPDNLRVFFSEGNIPRAFVAIFLPYLLYFIWQFIEYKKKYALIISIFFMILIIFCHIMIAAMLGITIFIYLLYYGILNKKIGPSVQMLVGLLLSFALCGFWLYPALQGGLMSLDSEAVSSVMKSLTFPFTQSLNPMLRYGNIEIFYFGISVMFIAFTGIFLSKRKSIPGFLTVITIFIGTTTALVPILIKLPLNQLLWMMRFTPVVYGIFLVSILTWKKLKKFAVVILVIILAADCYVSFKLLAFNSAPNPEIVNFLNDGIKATNQRIAILDESEFGSFPSFYLTNSTNQTSYAYGWAWQGAKTAQNIVLINTALENEYYVYMFDRCLELGCDTVIVKKDKVKNFDNLISGANRNQYNLIKEYNLVYLFKRQTPQQFGMTIRYYGLAVGKSSPNISLEFPGFEVGNTNFIDDYTLEDLLSYKVIYLSDFLYHDKIKSQQLVLSASEKGVKFIIDMNRVPNDPINNRMTFLDVTAQPIQFENKLPDLYYVNLTYVPTTFKEEYKNWNTVYLENLENPYGFSWFYGNKLDFIGTSKNSNITFIGFNILYHGIVNKDSNVISIFENEMGILKNTLPKRTIKEINIEYSKNTIKMIGPCNDINTTFANLDSFAIDGQSYAKHNLLFMKNNSITINMTYPYLKQGILVSSVGFVLEFILVINLYKRRDQLEK